jgi:two-component system sensor kinase FixL
MGRSGSALPTSGESPAIPVALEQALDLVQVLVRDLDGTIRMWTRGMERLYGWPRAEALGRNSRDLLKTVFPRPLAEIEAQLMDDGQWAGELVHRRRDDQVVVAASRWSLCRDGDGGVRAVTEVDNDVTRERHEDEALRYLASIVESSDDAIIGKTVDGIVTSWNRAAQLMFGYTAEEMIGQRITVLFPPDRIAEEDEIVERLKQAERVDHFETVRRRKDGADIPVSLTISPILDSSGRIVGVSKIARDITERRLMRSRLDDLQSELFHVARLSTGGHLASALAHELNQPLSAISNYLRGARRLLGDRPDDLSVTLQGAVEQASDQALRAGQIIRRMREFMSRGETEFRIESTARIVEEASAFGLLGARERGIEVQLDLDPSVDLVLVDKIQVQQVLLNLLRNAVEAMEGADRRVLTIASAAAKGEMALISVTDTGPGIAEDVAARLFQPFVTTKRQGMGVGLSISRTIVEAHGGRIWVEPNPGGGTVFRLTLRLASSEAAGDAG